MGFLSPLFLLAGLTLVIPLILHLFHRNDARRMNFPALRYLLRTEKEHAQIIRLRQLLLLILRLVAILLLVSAGARPFIRGQGGVHDPTALVIILDNSMSSGLIREGDRVLDLLKKVALKSVNSSSDEDVVWLIRAGQPWDIAITGPRTKLQEEITATETTHAKGNIVSALEKAIVLISRADLPASEIHLISDMQASAFTGISTTTKSQNIPVIIFKEDNLIPWNSHLDSLVIGEGLPPLVNQRTQLSIRISNTANNDTVPMRLAIGNQIRATTTARSGESTVFPFGPFTIGQVNGYVETDPDDLRSDNQIFFTFRVRPSPAVATEGILSVFLSEGLSVLKNSGRIQLTQKQDSDILISIAGAGVTDTNRNNQITVIVPPMDPALLPSLNRSLNSAGIPWQYELVEQQGELGITQWNGPVDLSEIRIRSHYLLTPKQAGLKKNIIAYLSSEKPWLVEGTTPEGPYLLLASDLEHKSTNLTVTAAMIPFLEWMTTRWDHHYDRSENIFAGESINAMPGITAIRDPQGNLHPTDKTQAFHNTRWTGLYEMLQNDSIVNLVAVNTHPSESILIPIDYDDLKKLVPEPMTIVEDSALWTHALFSTSQGHEIWRWLLVTALIVLFAESIVAASGPTVTARNSAPAIHTSRDTKSF